MLQRYGMASASVVGGNVVSLHETFRVAAKREVSFMYEEFYGLSRKPFSITPDPSFIYWGRGHRLAFTMLQYGVLNQAGITVITGSIGCGKTTLIERLLAQLDGTITVGTLTTLHDRVTDLLAFVLMAFGEPFEDMSEVAKLAALEDFLEHEHEEGRRCILIVDEAQNLGVALLEQLRTLSNFTRDGEPLLQLILVGQPQLRDLLRDPRMVQFVQRVSSDYHIKPLAEGDVSQYIEKRLSIAGRNAPLFDESAVARIYEVTGGVPRLINLLCDTALVYGFSSEKEMIDAEIINEVVADKGKYGVFSYTEDLVRDPVGARAAGQAQQDLDDFDRNRQGLPSPSYDDGRRQRTTRRQAPLELGRTKAGSDGEDKPALVINDPELARLLIEKLQSGS